MRELCHGSTGGVPWVWNELIVFRPQAWPLARSASLQLIVSQSGAKISRATGVAQLDPVAARFVEVEDDRQLDGVLRGKTVPSKSLRAVRTTPLRRTCGTAPAASISASTSR